MSTEEDGAKKLLSFMLGSGAQVGAEKTPLFPGGRDLLPPTQPRPFTPTSTHLAPPLLYWAALFILSLSQASLWRKLAPFCLCSLMPNQIIFLSLSFCFPCSPMEAELSRSDM